MRTRKGAREFRQGCRGNYDLWKSTIADALVKLPTATDLTRPPGHLIPRGFILATCARIVSEQAAITSIRGKKPFPREKRLFWRPRFSPKSVENEASRLHGGRGGERLDCRVRLLGSRRLKFSSTAFLSGCDSDVLKFRPVGSLIYVCFRSGVSRRIRF